MAKLENRKICVACNFHIIRKREPLSYCKKHKREAGLGDPACEFWEKKNNKKKVDKKKTVKKKVKKTTKKKIKKITKKKTKKSLKKKKA